MYYVLYNPKAGSNTGEATAKKLDAILKGEQIKYQSVLEIKDYAKFISDIGTDAKIVLVGGDGSLCHFANDIHDLAVKNDIYFFAGGTGNDFLNDLEVSADKGPIQINKYLVDLPHVIINGQKTYFVNGIGYGIDGYCCEVADQIHATSDAPVNYTAIAIKGLLGKFKPRNATITVDGKTQSYKKVWLAPTMNGRYYGGGMNCAPNQDRLNKDRKLSCVVMHCSLKLYTLMVFPSIFKGAHIKHTKMVHVFEGYDIKVEFDKPCALQIDGETVLNVKSYEARSSKLEK